MPINPYMNFSQYNSDSSLNSEQSLMQDLIIECIQIHGMEIYYIPRTLNKIDQIFGEDILSSFDKYYPVEVYFDSNLGFNGEGNFLTKFGLEIRKEASLLLSASRFNEVSGTLNSRPLEGDLIYIPMSKDLWEIKYADFHPENFFFQLGKTPVWKLTIERFVYSNENIVTGNTEIDNISDVLQRSDGTLTKEKFNDNAAIQTESNAIVDFSETDPFSEENRY